MYSQSNELTCNIGKMLPSDEIYRKSLTKSLICFTHRGLTKDVRFLYVISEPIEIITNRENDG